MKQSIEEKTIRSLRVHYYGSYVLLGSLFLFVFFRSKRFSETPQPLNMALQQYGIFITLAAIPLALKTFANMIKRKRDKERTTQETITVYKKAFFLRLYLLDCVILGNIILYAISYNQNYAWLTVILFLTLLFCKPSYQELEELIPREKEDEQIA